LDATPAKASYQRWQNPWYIQAMEKKTTEPSQELEVSAEEKRRNAAKSLGLQENASWSEIAQNRLRAAQEVLGIEDDSFSR